MNQQNLLKYKTEIPCEHCRARNGRIIRFDKSYHYSKIFICENCKKFNLIEIGEKVSIKKLENRELHRGYKLQDKIVVYCEKCKTTISWYSKPPCNCFESIVCPTCKWINGVEAFKNIIYTFLRQCTI